MKIDEIIEKIEKNPQWMFPIIIAIMLGISRKSYS